ncbi:MAG: CPBP family intramembrane metalloprotease, partial [Opitutae bacterium]|nr:CPBP family intramembrane metalloprotease [Opitutae bacterium]
FEVAIPLHVRLEAVESRRAALTEDQMWMVDVAEANSRVICSGGAGTGKTFLALELARRWTATGLRVLLVCRSPWLRQWLATCFAIPGVSVCLAEAAAVTARRLAIDAFDALIVDEGQDLLDLTNLDRLDGLIAGGLEQGRWCFFHDTNNQAGFFGPPDPDALALLESCGPTRVQLKTNCRNTRQILEQVQTSLGADMGVRGSGDGPQVRHCRVKSRQDAAQALHGEIERFIDRGGLQPEHISILSPKPFADSAAALLPADGPWAMAATGVFRAFEAIVLLAWVAGSRPGLAAIGLTRASLKSGLSSGLAWSAGFGVVVLGAGAILYLGFATDPLTLIRLDMPQDPVDGTIFFLVAGIVSPIAEEICFRGIVYALLRRWGAAAAIVGSTLLFAAAHTGGGIPVVQGIGGLLFACAMEKSRSLAAPVTIHVLGNLSLYSLSMI